MALEPDLKALMVQTISVQSISAIDVYAEGTYAPARTFKAREQEGTREVRTKDGQIHVATLTLYVDARNDSGAIDDISPEDQVTLADGAQPLIWAVYYVADERGPHHQECLASFEKGRPR